jgi:2-polyprenyl-3-methyl-5-hydroxy-6-metoxy-1,4-benzoquinol methylase
MDLKELPARSFTRHPWEIVRADFLIRCLRKRVAGQGLSALDIGAGDGYLAQRLLAGLPAVARITCFDLAYDAKWVQEKADNDSRLTFTAHKPAGQYDLVLMLDVLEHVEDDLATLREAASDLLKPGGWMLLSVPASQALFSRHDGLLGHKRRYAPARLRALVKDAQLALIDQGELFASLLLPRALAKLGEVALGRHRFRASPEPSHIDTYLGTWNHGHVLTATVTAALLLDVLCSRIASHLRLPFVGLSTWVLAQRR